MIKKVLNKLAAGFGVFSSLTKRHWRSMAYYACMAVVLCAVAYAAEKYRNTPEYIEPMQPVIEMTETEAAESPVFLPAEGMRCIRDYAEDAVWNEMLCLWESHAAGDYVFEGDKVAAFCDGEVTAIGCSGRNGNYMEIQSGEYLLRYCSVTADGKKQTGDKVRAGEAIGFADGSMSGESYMPPHVHMEAFFEGEPVDIGVLLQNQNKTASNS